MRTGLSSAVLALVPFVCSCQGVVVGNLAVLAITIGIFLGTLSLGRGA